MIAVCGPDPATAEEEWLAEAVGRAVAGMGLAVVCGGRGGVMAAACRGAKVAGGTTIGILPGYDPAEANPWVDYPICTGMGQARNAVVVASGIGVVAVGGGFGTLSEIGLALKLGKRVAAIQSWSLDPARVARYAAGDATFLIAVTPEEAVQMALGLDTHAGAPPSGHG